MRAKLVAQVIGKLRGSTDDIEGTAEFFGAELTTEELDAVAAQLKVCAECGWWHGKFDVRPDGDQFFCDDCRKDLFVCQECEERIGFFGCACKPTQSEVADGAP